MSDLIFDGEEELADGADPREESERVEEPAINDPEFKQKLAGIMERMAQFVEGGGHKTLVMPEAAPVNLDEMARVQKRHAIRAEMMMICAQTCQCVQMGLKEMEAFLRLQFRELQVELEKTNPPGAAMTHAEPPPENVSYF